MVQSLGIWSKSERWKSDKRCLMSWMKIKKIIVLKCHFLLFNTITMNHVLIGLWHVMKVDFIWEPVMTSSVIGPRNSKALTKAKLAPKKGHGHWWSAAGLIHYSFLNPSKTITTEKYDQPIHEMHEKLQSLQPALFNRKGPILFHNTWLHQHFKSWTNWAMKLCLICHIQLTTTSSSVLTTFCRKTLP